MIIRHELKSRAMHECSVPSFQHCKKTLAIVVRQKGKKLSNKVEDVKMLELAFPLLSNILTYIQKDVHKMLITALFGELKNETIYIFILSIKNTM